MNKFNDYKQNPIDHDKILEDLTKKGTSIPLTLSKGFLKTPVFVALLAGILVACGAFVLLEDGLLLLEIKTFYSTFSAAAFKLAANIMGGECTIVAGDDYIALNLVDQDLIWRVMKAVLPHLHHPVFLAGLTSLMVAYLNSNPKVLLKKNKVPLDLDPLNRTFFLWGLWFACTGFWKHLLFPFVGNSLWFDGADTGIDLIKMLKLLTPIYPEFSKEEFKLLLGNTARKIVRVRENTREFTSEEWSYFYHGAPKKHSKKSFTIYLKKSKKY